MKKEKVLYTSDKLTSIRGEGVNQNLKTESMNMGYPFILLDVDLHGHRRAMVADDFVHSIKLALFARVSDERL